MGRRKKPVFDIELRHISMNFKKRNRSISVARQVAIFLLRDLTQMSFPEIGREMGGRDHSTAMYAFRSVEENRDSDAVLSRDIETLKRRLLQL